MMRERSLLSVSRLGVVVCAGLVVAWPTTLVAADPVAAFEVRVEVEETAFPCPAYKVTNNGSGMFWGSGNTQIVRIGEALFASAFEAVPGCAPLNNARWALYQRGADGWHLCQRDDKERTREPCPLGVSHGGRLLMSVNPTLAPWIDAPSDLQNMKMAKRGGDLSHKSRGGPARPEVLEFDRSHPDRAPVHHLPAWQDAPKFTEHSYRTFAVDGDSGESILFQNIGYTHSEWAFLDRKGHWKTGQIHWPKRTVDRAYTPYHGTHARVNYPNVMLAKRAVHLVGHSAHNIWNRIDPTKSETWGRANWGGRFRKLHYAWTPDITNKPFFEWTVVDDTMDEGGTLCLGDCWLAPGGRVHVVWNREPIHPKLRDTHFPDIKRERSLWYGTLREGKLLQKRMLLSGGDETGPLWPQGRSRFHVTPDHSLYIICSLRGVSKETKGKTGNYALRIEDDETASAPVRIPLERPFTMCFTATPRSGNRLTEAADLLISSSTGGRSEVRYARIRFCPPTSPLVAITGRTFAPPGQGREIKLQAEVSDPQNDVTSVRWRLPGGVAQEGTSLTWTAPATVGDRIAVVAEATDREGHTTRALKTVSLPPPALADVGDLIVVEAERFVGQGGGEVRVCYPINVAKASISYWHKDIGHWLEWDLDVPEAGRYELWMRYTTASTGTRRSLLIDGTSPGDEFADIAIPTTGGWSGTEDNWAYARLASPLALTPGRHRLRLTNLADGLGVDFFVLRLVK